MMNHTRNARQSKSQEKTVTRLGKFLWDTVRERVSKWNFGPNRKERRQEAALEMIANRVRRSTQHSRDKHRYQAKAVARRRRNRKLATKLHRLERA